MPKQIQLRVDPTISESIYSQLNGPNNQTNKLNNILQELAGETAEITSFNTFKEDSSLNNSFLKALDGAHDAFLLSVDALNASLPMEQDFLKGLKKNK